MSPFQIEILGHIIENKDCINITKISFGCKNCPLHDIDDTTLCSIHKFNHENNTKLKRFEYAQIILFQEKLKSL